MDKQKLVFLVSLLFNKVRGIGVGLLFEGGGGGGHLFEIMALGEGTYLQLAMGRALIRVWALIRGNTLKAGKQ